jgi:signal transduction histidine kinase
MKPAGLVAIVVIGALIAPTLASARIGETMPECEKRYGKPAKLEASQFAPKAVEATYDKDGLSIHVLFIDGRAEKIIYAQPSAFTDEETTKLLANNAGGETWKAASAGDSSVYRSWETAKGATAEYLKPKPWEPLASFQYCLEIRSSKLAHLVAHRVREKEQRAEEQADAATRRLEAARQKAEAAKQEEERQRLKRLDNL